MSEVTYAKGLEGVITAESTICKIDGDQGRLYYRGIPIRELATNSSYEEVTYLLLYEKLPTRQELDEFKAKMRKSRGLYPAVIDMIKGFPAKGKPMELLQSVISYLSGSVEHVIEHSATCNCRNTLHQAAQLPSVIAAYKRIREGLDYIEPDPTLDHGSNFLYMLNGKKPEAYEGRIMDICFLLHAEHGFNASTFTARVVASTLSTCYSGISAAIGALYGSLHGGANEKVLQMLNAIGSPENVEPWVKQALSEDRKIMGMGHRVYKAIDPRAVIMEDFLKELSTKKHNIHNYGMLKHIQGLVRAYMEHKGKPIYPNVDFFSGSVYSLLGVPGDLFTPIFAAARSAGWLAHILEQRQDNRIYRPRCLYNGPEPTSYVPLEKRGGQGAVIERPY